MARGQLRSPSPKRTVPKAEAEEDPPVVPPPASVVVDYHTRLILFLPDGKPLVRKVGF